VALEFDLPTRATAVGLYVGIGLTLTSLLHTWYARYFYPRLRFGLPFTERISVRLPHLFGYVGSTLLGIASGVVVATITARILSEPVTLQTLVRSRGVWYASVTAVLLTLSQVIAGASWSKLFLDGMLLLVGFVIVVSFVQALTIWNTVSVVIVAVGGLLAGGWRLWSAEFVEPRADRARVPDTETRYPTWEFTPETETSGLLFPHFPTFSYFVLSSLYIVAACLVTLVAYWNFASVG
jgi:hypothetical protein